MFEIVFLGTSASAPSIQRGLSAQIIKHNEHRFLLDCGEGTQRQILRSGLGFRRINRILLTHGHLDHILGLAGLFSTFFRWETLEDIEIYGGQWTIDRVYQLLFGVRIIPKKFLDTKIHLNVVTPGKLIEEDDFSISAFEVNHRGPDCYGFLFEENSHRPFQSEKAEALGIPHGPIRKELVSGKNITLENGTTIQPDQVLGEAQPGARVAFTGDMGNDMDGILRVCNNVDLLVSEATYLESEADMAEKFLHLTAAQAARMALNVNAGKLLLTHISRRYREKDILNEARGVFPNTDIVRDFDVYQAKRGDILKIEN
ncbi:MAG: ribonuclease Z [Anaerolineales bacterium]|nr:ribonuclease Z [Anaerolineales bacterium]